MIRYQRRVSQSPSMLPADVRGLSRQLSRIVYCVLYGVIGLKQSIGSRAAVGRCRYVAALRSASHSLAPTFQQRRELQARAVPHLLRPDSQVAERKRSARGAILNIDGVPIVVTAAHILDQRADHTLCIAGHLGTSPVPILGGVGMIMPKLDDGRASDHFDTAIWQLPAHAVEGLGAVDFLDASRISQNREPSAGRLYTALGYPPGCRRITSPQGQGCGDIGLGDIGLG